MKNLILFALLISSALTYGKNKTWTCLTENGHVAFTLEAKRVYDFSDELAAVKVSEVVNNAWVTKIGFVDVTGKMVIAPKYDKIKGLGFKNGRAWVKNKSDKFWTLIDKQGNEIPTGNYDKVAYIHEINGDMLGVYQGDLLGFIDINGKEIIPCKYLGGTTFHLGLACVTTNDESTGYGFINRKGEVVIPLQYKQAGIANFMENGMCRATVAGKTVLIDTKGNVVFKTSKGNIQGMSNGWVRVFTNNDRTGWGFLNFEDEWMIKPDYTDLKNFDMNGRAMASKNDLWGLIDKDNNVLLPFKYESLWCEPLEDGYILGAYPTKEPQSLMNTPKDYFTPDLKPVNMKGIKYIYSAEGASLMPYQAENGKKGYLNRDFSVEVEAQYSKAEGFHDGLAWVLP